MPELTPRTHPANSLRRVVIAIATTVMLIGFVSLHVWRSQADAQTLQADGKLKWYRGNMHTHSLWSDGDDYLESIALWYREHNYQFLVFTDHNVLAEKERWIDVEKSKGKQRAFDKLRQKFPQNWVESRQKTDEDTKQERLETRLKTFREVSEHFNDAGRFLLIQGEEVSDAFGKFPIHMNASNVREVIVPRHGTSVFETIQNNTDALVAQRERTGQAMLIHLNHPNYGFGVTAEDLMRVRGENFFEVYNGHPGVKNTGDREHASTERIWDIINSFRLSELKLPPLFGLATDDGHAYHEIPSRASEPGRGWVMVLAETLNAESLVASLEAGRFYSSSGVTLDEVTASPRELKVTVHAQPETKYVIEFIGTRRGFNSQSEPILDKDGKEIRATRKYSDEIGRILYRTTGTSTTYRFSGDELYVRARVTSSKPHPNPSEIGEVERAWTQPVLGAAATLE